MVFAGLPGASLARFYQTCFYDFHYGREYKMYKILAIAVAALFSTGVLAQSATVQGMKQDGREIKAEAREAKANIKADAHRAKARMKAKAHRAKAKMKAAGHEMKADAHVAKENMKADARAVKANVKEEAREMKADMKKQ